VADGYDLVVASRPPLRRDEALTHISLFGLVHVGLITATCFPKKGHEVVGIGPEEELFDFGKDKLDL